MRGFTGFSTFPFGLEHRYEHRSLSAEPNRCNYYLCQSAYKAAAMEGLAPTHCMLSHFCGRSYRLVVFSLFSARP